MDPIGKAYRNIRGFLIYIVKNIAGDKYQIVYAHDTDNDPNSKVGAGEMIIEGLENTAFKFLTLTQENKHSILKASFLRWPK